MTNELDSSQRKLSLEKGGRQISLVKSSTPRSTRRSKAFPTSARVNQQQAEIDALKSKLDGRRLKTDVDRLLNVKKNYLEKAQKDMKEVGCQNLPNSWPRKNKSKVEHDRNTIVTIEPSIEDLEAIIMDQTTKAIVDRVKAILRLTFYMLR